MYDPADEFIRSEEERERAEEWDARLDAEACDMVDAMMQGDYE